DPRGIQPVADIGAGHQDLRARLARADVVRRIRVAYHSTAHRGIGNEALTREALLNGPRKCRARYEVEQARSRRTERRAERVIAERKVLRVVPQSGDRVAVVVPQRAVRAQNRVTAAVHQKAVHEAAVECELLVAVAVILIAGERHAAVNPKRIGAVRIVAQQPRALQVVDTGGAGAGATEVDAAVLVRQYTGVGAEVVVKRDVLLKDRHYVLDRCIGPGSLIRVGCAHHARGTERGTD